MIKRIYFGLATIGLGICLYTTSITTLHHAISLTLVMTGSALIAIYEAEKQRTMESIIK